MPQQTSLSSRWEMTSYGEVLDRFRDQHTVTVAAGVTCAFLGDERNLREFLVADEVARVLRRAGHVVHFLLINDSLDPLNFRQLRVAVNKDAALIEKFTPWCGKAISQLPDPFGCHESFSDHFEDALLARLHGLGCHPTPVSTAKLYARGRYAPFVRLALEESDAILKFLAERFPTYTPDKLFWPLCPRCRYLDETRVVRTQDGHVTIRCERCQDEQGVALEEVEGKLNWKLDCAARWVLLGVDIEPFAKPYLEPGAGSFFVAHALAREFFGLGERSVTPFQYGSVEMPRELSLKLLDSLPGELLRSLMVNRPATDFALSRDGVINQASRHEVAPDVSYLDFVRQLLPMWLLTPEKLSRSERDLVAHGIAFNDAFLETSTRLHLPTRAELEGEETSVLRAVHALLERIIEARADENLHSKDESEARVRREIEALGKIKGRTLRRLRIVVGQQQGLPAARFLASLPLNYLRTVEFLIALYVDGAASTQQEHSTRALWAA